MTTTAYRFRRDCLVRAPGVSTQFSQISEAYRRWCCDRGRPFDERHLQTELRAAGVQNDPETLIALAYLDIRLRSADDDTSLRDLLRAYDARPDWRDAEIERAADRGEELIADVLLAERERTRLVWQVGYELRNFGQRAAVLDHLWKATSPRLTQIRYERHLARLPHAERLARIERLRNLPREHDVDDPLGLPGGVDGGEVGGLKLPREGLDRV